MGFARFYVAATVAVACLTPAASAAEQNTNPLTATVRLQPSSVSPGQTADLLFDLDLADGFHAYADKFKVAIESPDDLKVADLKLSPIVKFFDVVSKSQRDGVEKKSKATAVLEVPFGTQPRPLAAKVKLTYQACAKDYCLFPKTLSLDLKFEVVAPVTPTKAASNATTAPPLASSTDVFGQAMGQSFWLAILVVFGMGVLTSLTPCIYPMIPITLAILGARTKGQSRLKSFSLSVTYVLGIAVTYSALGVAAARTGVLFGSALGNVYVVTGIAILFVLMALSMYGLFDLQVPAAIRNKLGAAPAKSGHAGAFLTGLIAGVVASPCVGPVLVSVLTYIAETQNTWVGFVLLFSFALGLGLLFIVLGTFSSLLNRMPKAGPWMDLTKFVFGTVMVAMAIYYVVPVYPAWLVHVLIGLAAVAIAVSYGAFRATTHSTPLSKLKKFALLAMFVFGLVVPVLGVLHDVNEPKAKLRWQPYSDRALADALKAKKPIVVDFYADWCGACKEMERDTFPDSRIQAESSKFVLLQFDATNDSPQLDELKKTYRVMGLPTMIFYDVGGTIRGDLTVTGFENADQFLAKMNAAQTASPAR